MFKKLTGISLRRVGVGGNAANNNVAQKKARIKKNNVAKRKGKRKEKPLFFLVHKCTDMDW